MIDTQLLTGVLTAVAVLVGAAVALSLAFVAAAVVTGRSQVRHAAIRRDLPPHGGSRRDLSPDPQPDPDDARELVLR